MKTVRIFLLLLFSIVSASTASASSIHDAVRNSDYAKLETRLKAYPKIVNEWDDQRRTALHNAVSMGDMRAIRLLVEHGADVNARSGFGAGVIDSVPLSFPDETRRLVPDPERAKEILQYLADHGAALTLSAAIRMDDTATIKSILEDDPQLLSKDLCNRMTPLLFSCSYGTDRTSRLLLDMSGGDMSAPEKLVPLLTAAATTGNTGVAQMLVGLGVPVDNGGETSNSPLGRAIRFRNMDMVKYLVSEGANVNQGGDGRGKTCLHLAAEGSLMQAVELLLANGADINAESAEDGTPLMTALRYGRPDAAREIARRTEPGDLLTAVVLGDIVSVRTKLREDPKLAAAEFARGITPLHAAMIVQEEAIAELLIDKGADVDAVDAWKRTPLLYAIRSHDLDLVKLLIKAGADPEKARDSENTRMLLPLEHAAGVGDAGIVSYLVKSGASVNTEGLNNDLPIAAAFMSWDREMAKLLASLGIDPDYLGKHGSTPLGRAIFYRFPETAAILVEKGGDPTLGKVNAKSPIEMAVSRGYLELVDLMLKKNRQLAESENVLRELIREAAASGQMELIDYFVGMGANTKWILNSSALCYAAKDGYIETFAFLDSQGIELKGDFLNAALAGAVQGSQIEMTRMLLDKGADPSTEYGYPGNLVVQSTERGRLEVLQLLLEHGALPDVPRRQMNSSSQKQPLAFALDKGYPGKAKTLVEHGASLKGGVLAMAIGKGMPDVARLMVEKGADIDENRCRALSALTYSGDTELVRLLLDKGASLVAKEENAKTPCFVEQALECGHKEIAIMLIKAGADVNGSYPSSSLCSAAKLGDLELVEMLLEAGLDPKAKSVERLSPLTNAVFGGNREIVERFLELGADANDMWKDDPPPPTKNSRYYTPLNAAAFTGNTDIARLLVEKGADVNLLNGMKAAPILVAARGGKADMVRFLIDQGADLEIKGDKEMTPLLAAAETREIEVIRLLLKRGANPNVADVNGKTPLHYACEWKGTKEMVELLLDSGADANKTDEYGNTPLSQTCSLGRLDVAELLISKGADVSPKSGACIPPLSSAIARNNQEIVDLLKKHGAVLDGDVVLAVVARRTTRVPTESDIASLQEFDKLDFSTRSGQSVWIRAIQCGIPDYVELLLEKGADPNSLGEKQPAPIISVMNQFYMPVRNNPFIKEAEGRLDFYANSPDHMSYQSDMKREIIELLLEAGGKPDVKDEKGNTALHIAVGKQDIGVVRVLVDGGANLDATDSVKRTPLHIAAMNGSRQIVEYLIEKGADPGKVDTRGKIPADYSRSKEILDILNQKRLKTNEEM